MRNVLLLGLKGVVVEDAMTQLALPDVRLFGGGSIEDARRAFESASIDTVIMGAGLDLETRLQIVRTVFELSETTTVHMKDRATGPEGFIPFVRRVLRGLAT